MMKKIAYLLMFLGVIPAIAVAQLPTDWKAVGTQFGGEGMVDQYQGNLHLYYAEKVPARGLILSDAFEIKQPWINLKFKEDQFAGIISLIAVDDEGNYREVRNIPSSALQGEGWLNDGWFAFDVKDLIGLRVYFQVKGLRHSMILPWIRLNNPTRVVAPNRWIGMPIK